MPRKKKGKFGWDPKEKRTTNHRKKRKKEASSSARSGSIALAHHRTGKGEASPKGYKRGSFALFLRRKRSSLKGINWWIRRKGRGRGGQGGSFPEEPGGGGMQVRLLEGGKKIE